MSLWTRSGSSFHLYHLCNSQLELRSGSLVRHPPENCPSSELSREMFLHALQSLGSLGLGVGKVAKRKKGIKGKETRDRGKRNGSTAVVSALVFLNVLLVGSQHLGI